MEINSLLPPPLCVCVGVSVCLCVCEYEGTHAEVKGQLEESVSLFPPGSQGSNSGSQAWRQMPLLADLSHQPFSLCFCETRSLVGPGTHDLARLASSWTLRFYLCPPHSCGRRKASRQGPRDPVSETWVKTSGTEENWPLAGCGNENIRKDPTLKMATW